MKKLLFTLILLTTTVSAYSQLLNWNATQNKSYSLILKGDANSDGEVDISDVVFVVNEILSGDSYQELCDVNGDGYVDISDVVELVNIILNGNQTSLCPDDNHPHMIDLGLPSGTKWACCNVGASSPEEYGGYYAWGETEEKSVYNPDTYLYSRTWYDMDDIGSDIAGTQYDVAHVRWGGSWRMPTYDQINELVDFCFFKETKINGVDGGLFTGRFNGKSVFLPAACLWDEVFEIEQFPYPVGFYWSSTVTEPMLCSYFLGFNSGRATAKQNIARYFGLPVRPVR